MNVSILNGTFYITDDLNFVLSVPDRTVKVISLDEDGDLSPNNPNVIVGTCLLPPMECFIAEADGDEDLYNIYYIAHLNTPFLQEFIGALIAALYRGTSLLIYAPQLKENISIQKLRQNLWNMYGVLPGIIGGEPNQFDPRCVPIWMTMIYSANVISPEEFLMHYPDDAQVSPTLIDKLMMDLRPYGESYKERLETLNKFQLKLKKNPRVKLAVFDLSFK